MNLSYRWMQIIFKVNIMITQTYNSILKMVKILYVWGRGLYDYHRVLYVIWAENAKQNLNLAIWAEFKK